MAAAKFQKIYIQNFSGQRFQVVRDIFLDTVEEQGQFTVTEILPNRFEKLVVLRVHVTDYSIWENEELVATAEEGVLSEEKSAEILMRRNVLIGARIALFEASTGKALFRQNISQPFQQIYIGTQAIQQRPTKQQEVQRIIRLLSSKILESISKGERQIPLELERGKGTGWIATYIYDEGNQRLLKGVNLAKTGDYEQAILIWRLILFGPEQGEEEENYLRTRASAFYNLGEVYDRKGDWWYAAKMFSKANRLQQKLKYAQSWGDSMHQYLALEEEKAILEQRKGEKRLRRINERELLRYTQPSTIDNLENNEDFLLKPRDLWPLEQRLKERQREEEDQLREEQPKGLQPTELEPLEPKS